MIKWNFVPYKVPSSPGLYSTVDPDRELKEFTDILIRKSKIEPDSFEIWLDRLEIDEIENDHNGYHIMPLPLPKIVGFFMRLIYGEEDEDKND